MAAAEPGLIVLGMHRSGTSCLAGMLQLAGFEAAEVEKWNPDNQRGNRENLRVVKLNDAVLHRNQAGWDQPPANDLVSAMDNELRAARNEILAEMTARGRPWMFKDPRTLLTLPFWREAIPNPYRLGIFRHPARVALSLYYRSQKPVAEGLALWLAYNRALLAEYDRAPFPIVCFDAPSRDFVSAVTAALQQECDELIRSGRLDVTKMQEFYATDLVHHRESEPEAILAQQPGLGEQLREAMALYARLCLLTGGPGQVAEAVLSTEPSASALAKLMLADQAVRDGNVDLGLQLYHETVSSTPNSRAVWLRILELLRKNNRLTEALASCHEALRALPTDPGLLVILAELIEKTGARFEALEQVERALALAPDWFMPWLRKGEWLYAEERFPEAIQALEQSIRLQPPGHFWSQHCRLAEALLRAGRAAEGNSSFQRALELASGKGRAVVYDRWAQAMATAGDDRAALAFQEQAAALAVNEPHIHVRLAKMLQGMGRDREAMDCLIGALEKGEDSVALRLLLARLAFSLGFAELAKTQVAVVAKREPAHPEVLRLKATRPG